MCGALKSHKNNERSGARGANSAVNEVIDGGEGVGWRAVNVEYEQACFLPWSGDNFHKGMSNGRGNIV